MTSPQTYPHRHLSIFFIWKEKEFPTLRSTHKRMCDFYENKITSHKLVDFSRTAKNLKINDIYKALQQRYYGCNNHYFCRNCLLNWLNKIDTCPLCRNSINY